MADLSIELLKKQIHDAEAEIEDIECKIKFADLKTTYPHEYAEMRSVQEQHRQQILKCTASIQDRVMADPGGDFSESLDS